MVYQLFHCWFDSCTFVYRYVALCEHVCTLLTVAKYTSLQLDWLHRMDPSKIRKMAAEISFITTVINTSQENSCQYLLHSRNIYYMLVNKNLWQFVFTRVINIATYRFEISLPFCLHTIAKVNKNRKRVINSAISCH